VSVAEWTPAQLTRLARPYDNHVWRIVESQWQVATMVLTDSLDEQALLEQILDEAKPPMPDACRGLHVLLATPFRYAPYPVGSRFRRANQPDGVFYASEKIETAVAETTFHRLLFFADAPGMRLPDPIELSAFQAHVATSAIDLAAEPLSRDRDAWAARADYSACQDFADIAREAAIGMLRYESARDPQRRANVALLSPAGFATQTPGRQQTWHLLIQARSVRCWCENPVVKLAFDVADFNDPRLVQRV
jgi:hypothetical protein